MILSKAREMMSKFCVCTLFLLLSVFALGQNQVVSIDDVSEPAKEKSKNFVLEIFKNKKLPKLSGKDASSYFRKKYKEVDILKAAKLYDYSYGEIVKLDLQEIISDNKIKWLRYTVKRTKSKRLFEIRMGLDKKEKFAAIVYKPFWSDRFYGFSEYPKFKPMDLSTVDSIFKVQSKDFAFRSYNRCNNDSLFKIDSTNTVYRTLKVGFNELQLKECDSIKNKNGNFKNIELLQAHTDSIYTNIYRFKINFEKLQRPSEIRVYTNLENKFKGVFVIDVWFDKFYIRKRAIEKSRNLLGI